MKLDLHLHTSERSSCSTATEKEQIESAVSFGLSGIAITDHNRLVPKSHIEDLNAYYAPFKIFTGIEIRTIDANEDILAIGLHDSILENKKWHYRELYEYVKKNNGYIAYPHPLRYSDFIEADAERFVPDAIELHSINIGRDDEPMLLNLANRLNTKVIANSDSHSVDSTGIYYNEFSVSIHNDAELVEALKQGLYTIGCDRQRIDVMNQKIRIREAQIKEYIKMGKTRMEYADETGNWEGYYDKIFKGRGLEI